MDLTPVNNILDEETHLVSGIKTSIITAKTRTKKKAKNLLLSVIHIFTSIGTLPTRDELERRRSHLGFSVDHDSDDEENQKPKQRKTEREIPEIVGEENDNVVDFISAYFVIALVVFGFVFGLIGFMAETSHLVDLSAFTIVVLAPTLLVQKYELRALMTSRQHAFEFKQYCLRLQEENEKLKKKMDRIHEINEERNEITEKIEQIALEQRTRVDALVGLVHECGATQRAIKKILHTKVAHEVIGVVVGRDLDGDFLIGPDEQRSLRSRLKTLPYFGHENLDAYEKLVKKARQERRKAGVHESHEDVPLLLSEILGIVWRSFGNDNRVDMADDDDDKDDDKGYFSLLKKS